MDADCGIGVGGDSSIELLGLGEKLGDCLRELLDSLMKCVE